MHKRCSIAADFSVMSHHGIFICARILFVTRCQRVRVGQLVSSRKTLSGGMPQGSQLGPLSFIVLIYLRAAREVHKFVDDTTFSELIPSTGYE